MVVACPTISRRGTPTSADSSSYSSDRGHASVDLADVSLSRPISSPPTLRPASADLLPGLRRRSPQLRRPLSTRQRSPPTRRAVSVEPAEISAGPAPRRRDSPMADWWIDDKGERLGSYVVETNGEQLLRH